MRSASGDKGNQSGEKFEFGRPSFSNSHEKSLANPLFRMGE